MYRSRFLDELPAAERPARYPAHLLPHSGPYPAGAAGDGWGAEEVIFQRFDDMQSRYRARAAAWHRLAAHYDSELVLPRDATGFSIGSLPRVYNGSFLPPPGFNTSTGEEDLPQVWIADWSVDQDKWNTGAR